jgi:hypothetical protein
LTPSLSAAKASTGTDAKHSAYWMQQNLRQSQKPQKSNVAGGDQNFASQMGLSSPQDMQFPAA